MIRHIALLYLHPRSPEDAATKVEVALRELAPAGMLSLTVARDLSLAPDTADWVIIIDFEDESAYLAFGSDEGHLRIRQESLQPVLERATRCQTHLPDPEASAEAEIPTQAVSDYHKETGRYFAGTGWATSGSS